MPYESTPTTDEELMTALAAVTAAQDPAPWDPPYFWPRQVGNPPMIVKIGVNEDGDEVTIIYDDVLSGGSPNASQFEVFIPTETPGESMHVTVQSADAEGDYSILLVVEDDETSATPAQVTYTNGPSNNVGANGTAANDQTQYF